MAQSRKAKQGSNLNTFYRVLGVVALIGVVAIGWLVVRARTGGGAALEPVAVEGAEDPQALVEKAKGVPVGQENAPVKMLVFSDFQCPACQTFALQIEPVLVNEFVKPGTLQIVYYDFPLGGAHQYAFLAARAARCARDQNKYWDYLKILFARQYEWSIESDPPIGNFLSYGDEIGLNRDQLEQCIRSDQHQEVVSANRTLGEQLGVNATPTLFINGRKLPGNSFADLPGLRKHINEAAGTT
ncbi:MAG: DsbA family protein [Gemmatimonadota bacterium]